MTRHQLVMDYMKRRGGISSMDAIEAFGETRLAARICELREKGENIEDTWCENATTGARFKRYFLG